MIANPYGSLSVTSPAGQTRCALGRYEKARKHLRQPVLYTPTLKISLFVEKSCLMMISGNMGVNLRSKQPESSGSKASLMKVSLV